MNLVKNIDSRAEIAYSLRQEVTTVILKRVLIIVLGFVFAQTARAKIVEVFHLDPMDRSPSSTLYRAP